MARVMQRVLALTAAIRHNDAAGPGADRDARISSGAHSAVGCRRRAPTG
jgi:hypothetical protein